MKAILVNLFRRYIKRHPAAITRREESRRAKEARARRDAQDRARYMAVAEILRSKM